jgi:RNA polymerase sigma-70 factor (ECF subfamily)
MLRAGVLPVNQAAEVAWTELVGDLRRFLRRRLPDEATAEDVLQDVFVRVQERAEQLDDDSRLAPWVFRIARNAAIDHYRRRRPTQELPDELLQSDEAPAAVEGLGRWLMETIDSLPEGYREALRLTEVEGLSQKAAAERLGLSISGLKSRVQRGRKLLQGSLLRCCEVYKDGTGRVYDYRARQPCQADPECC